MIDDDDVFRCRKQSIYLCSICAAIKIVFKNDNCSIFWYGFNCTIDTHTAHQGGTDAVTLRRSETKSGSTTFTTQRPCDVCSCLDQCFTTATHAGNNQRALGLFQRNCDAVG